MTADHAQRGKFIVFEGSEGAGKSTQAARLVAQLEAKQIPYLMTREPGGTEIAEQIRELLLADNPEPLHAKTELLLMFAARSQHLQNCILPALAQGQWVICDRFTDSSYAYQGAGRAIDDATIAQLEQFVQADVRPDWVILLDLPIEQGLARAKQRGRLDRFEQQDDAFFHRVSERFRARAAQAPERYTVIDAALAVEQIEQRVLLEMAERFF